MIKRLAKAKTDLNAPTLYIPSFFISSNTRVTAEKSELSRKA